MIPAQRQTISAPRLTALVTASLVLAFAAVWSFAAAPTVPPAKADDIAALRVRADTGDAEALNLLGNAYATGTGVAADPMVIFQPQT
jgi:TPR repeat protein